MTDPQTDIGGTLAYWEWSAPDDADIDDINAVRAANPAFGTRINQDFLAVERGVMSDEEYARERLGIFPDHDATPQWEVISEDAWTAAESTVGDDAGWLAAPVTLAVEMPSDRSLVSVCVAGDCRDGGHGVDLVTQVGTDEIVDLLVSLTTNTDHPVARVIIDPTSPAGALVEDLEAAGVTITACKYADLKTATGDFFDGIHGDEIRHRARPELDRSVSTAVKRAAGDTWLVDRRTVHDASPFVAVILARWGHLRPPEPPAKKYRAGGFR